MTRSIAILWLLLGVASAAADDLVLDRSATLDRELVGNLTVRNGAAVTAQNIRITGNVRVESGASFYGIGVRIDGNLTADQSRNLTLKSYGEVASVVGGEVQVHAAAGAVRIFDAQIGGHSLVQDCLAQDIVIRDCSVGGDVQLFANQVTRYFVLRNNEILGNVQAALNQPAPSESGNRVSGPATAGSLIEVRAAGDEGSELFELQIDQRAVRRWTASRELRLWRYLAGEIVAPDRLRVAFVNDGSNQSGYDRNLIVDAVLIDGATYETEAESVYSSGVVRDGSVLRPGFHQSETLARNGYFQFGLTGVEDALIRLALNAALPDGWSSSIFDDGEDIRWRTADPTGRNGVQGLFGAAGVVSSLKDTRSGKQFLARKSVSDATDRMLQWTIWEQGQSAVFDAPSLPYWEDRFNITQAGTYANVIHGSVQVELSDNQGQLDVWSVSDRMWKSELEPHLTGSLTSLTRMNVLDGGALLVRRVVRVGRIWLRGNPIALENPLFEAWTPLSNTAVNAIALSLTAQGTPDRYYIDSQSIPNYPAWPVAETRGWALAYDRRNLSSGPTFAVVFGRDPGWVRWANGTEVLPRRFVLNTMDFSGGLGILPGLWPAGLPEGSLIDQYYIFAPGRGIPSGTAAMLDLLADRLPAPRVYHAGAVLSGELSVIADRLGQLSSEPRHFTVRLGTVD
jgi:hypothetical protein